MRDLDSNWHHSGLFPEFGLHWTPGWTPQIRLEIALLSRTRAVVIAFEMMSGGEEDDKNFLYIDEWLHCGKNRRASCARVLSAESVLRIRKLNV